MTAHPLTAIAITAALIFALPVPGGLGAGQPSTPLQLQSARVLLSGKSNIHDFTAESTSVRMTELKVASGNGDVLDTVLRPGGLEAFEVAVVAASLSSPRDGIDKNMHKALKTSEFADITLRVTSLEPTDTANAYRAAGVFRIAGVERPVTLGLTVERDRTTLRVQGAVDLLMTDFGIAPPRAMLGMLKTNPKVTVRFDGVLASR